MRNSRQDHDRGFGFPPHGIEAVIFDLDGVVTETADVHAAAWKEVFDEFLERRSADTGEPFRPFTDEDYGRYVDGKPRYEGADSFLRSRGIEMPFGDPDDPPGDDTVTAIGNRKNERFREMLHERGAKAYESSLRLILGLQRSGFATAAITASRNGRAVMQAAGVSGLFDVVIDGVDAADAGLAGKPEPDIFLEAARRLALSPDRAAVVEDAEAGVRAGRRGGFRFVLGVDRLGRAEELHAAGADEVVRDLSEVAVSDGEKGARLISEIPSAVEKSAAIVARLSRGRPVVFLDYDGTLAPIVEDPAEARMPATVREGVSRIAEVAPTVILSGRDLADVREIAALEGVYYAGSHGFEIAGPDGEPLDEELAGEFERFLPALRSAEEDLRSSLSRLEGVVVERKRYAIAVHYRRAEGEAVAEAERAVDRVAENSTGLRKTGGKKIFELRPDIDWDKGRALRRLLEMPGLSGRDAVPLFIGDDETDEDALREVVTRGVGIIVHGEEDRPTLAEYALEAPQETGTFLRALAEDIEEGRDR